MKENRIAVDTETRGLDWFNEDEQAFLATWSDEAGNDHLAHVDDASAVARLEAALHSADTIVCHNASFDAHQLRATLGIDLLKMPGKLVDTDLLARVVVPERRTGSDHEGGFGLKNLATTYVDDDAAATEEEIKRLAKEAGIKLKTKGGYYDLWRAYPGAMEAYAKQDTRLTIDLLPHLEKKVGSRFAPIWELEQEVTPHLIRAEARGVCVDQEKVAPLKAEYTQRRDAAHDAVVKELGDIELDGDDLAEALLMAGVPLHRKTEKSDKLAVNKFALAEFETSHPVITQLFEYRKCDKFLSTYIDPMHERDVVHPSFWQIGAWTGRMSCSRPNMQNLPVRGEGSDELRAMFVPRPGHCFVVSDFDQIELRLLAYYLNSEEFIQKIERGDDVFAELAARLAVQLKYADEYGTAVTDYVKGTKGGKLHRAPAKNGTYAICYGVGRKKLGDMFGLDPLGLVGGKGGRYGPDDWMVQRGYAEVGAPMNEPAAQVIRMVKGWLPGYHNLTKKRITPKVKKQGHVNTIMGRKQPIGADKAYVGLAGLIQGSAADIFKRALCLAADAIAPLGALPVLFVHDELVSECPIEHADECLRLQDEAMAQAFDLRPALAVSGSIAYHDYSQGK